MAAVAVAVVVVVKWIYLLNIIDCVVKKPKTAIVIPERQGKPGATC